METAEYLVSQVLQKTRCLVVSLDASRVVTDIACPWGTFTVKSIKIGSHLPDTLKALMDSLPGDQTSQLFSFIYLDDSLVVDVHIQIDGTLHQLILRDVSEIHQAELKFQQKAHEVSLLLEKQSELSRLLELQRSELERANQAKSRFIASMSHEFRTPITSIMGNADLLAKQLSDSRLPAAILRASWHLLALVENLLEQARQGEGYLQLNPTPVDLVSIFQDMSDLFSVQTAAKGLKLSVVAPPEPLQLVVDELRLRQVLINLLGNAIRFTEHGKVELAAHISTGEVTLQVSDTGPGIKPDDQELIFQPFTRLNPSSTSGAGLGLPITRQLIEAMGSQLILNSTIGRGSAFSFSLEIGIVNELKPVANLDGLDILLVDDDADLLAIYQLYLQDWGMQVTCASDLPQALELAHQDMFDLIMTDLHLLEDSGIDLLRVAKSKQKACKTILCSGAGISPEWQPAVAELADVFLLKPIRQEQLRSAIERVLGQEE